MKIYSLFLVLLGMSDVAVRGQFPTEPPLYLISTTTSRSVMVTWNTIECNERNGIITGYMVQFQEQGGASIPREVVSQNFTASGLTPSIHYIFRVAGVNSNDTGPFTTATIIITDEDTPGPVSYLVGQTLFSSLVLTWSSPQESNGVIISYEVTYRVNGGNLITTNTTDLSTTFTIPPLTPQTRVSNISVSAYTSIGRGEAARLSHQITLDRRQQMVMNVVTEPVSTNSVRVSWDPIDIPEITGYTVYYSQTGNRKRQSEELSVTVPSSVNSVVIGDLVNNVEYQFQVAAIAELGGVEFTGVRSVAVSESIGGVKESSNSVGPIVGGILVFVSAAIIVAMVLVFGAYWFKRRANVKEEGGEGPVYEEVHTTNLKVGADSLEMKVNKAYGTLASKN